MANSFVRYTGNGTTTTYAIPFSYRDTADLSATVAGVNITAYTLDAAGTNLTFTTAPANGSAIEIRRTTSQTTKLVDYVSGSVLTENDLDTDSDQAFFMSQEAIDDANDVISLDNADFQWNTQNKRLKNVADPTSAQDAATKNYLENTWLSPANKTALTTVNANIANINAVNSNSSNINSAVSNATNINTVATNIGSVNTVATDISKVIAVANDLAEAVSEVETVADDLNEATSEIDTVANSITNVNNVGNNIANVNTVAGISSNVTTVAGNNANVSTVAGISGNVTTVAGIASNVTSVANDATDIGTVATDIANVNTVAGISGNVTTVAGISSNVTSVANNSANINSVAGNSTNINTVAGNNSNISTVAGVSGNVTTVAGISADVTAVAGDATDIGTVATNLAGTNTIGTVAGSITNVNNVGGSIANVNTVAGNLSGVNYFGERYRVSATAPTTSLDVGDLYYDTATDAMKVYGSSGWQNAGSSVNGTSQRYNYTATSGQTTFTGADNNGNTLAYDAGYIDVYLNGVKLLNGTDVTVTSGSSVVLASGATTGDVVDIVAYGTFTVASLNADNLDSGTVPDARITGAYTGITNLTMSGNLTVDTDTFRVFNSGDYVQIGDGSSRVSFLSNSNDSLQIKNGIIFESGSSATNNEIFTYRSNSLIFGTGASERMRIDSSGNLLVGKTVTTANTAGTQISSATGVRATVDGNVATILNRTTSDGDIALFRKDNITVGSIFSRSGLVSGIILDPRAGGNGLLGQAGCVIPVDENQTREDNATDWGRSDFRWKDLYLGGGVYLGGTGTANKLDDYETGTWTVKLCDASSGGNEFGYTGSRTGNYTKIGDTVIAIFYARTDGSTSGITTSNQLFIQGLPFTCNAHNNSTTVISSTQGTLQSTLGAISAQVMANSSYIRFRKQYGDTSAPFSVQALLISEWEGGSGANVQGTIIYKV